MLCCMNLADGGSQSLPWCDVMAFNGKLIRTLTTHSMISDFCHLMESRHSLSLKKNEGNDRNDCNDRTSSDLAVSWMKQLLNSLNVKCFAGFAPWKWRCWTDWATGGLWWEVKRASCPYYLLVCSKRSESAQTTHTTRTDAVYSRRLADLESVSL